MVSQTVKFDHTQGAIHSVFGISKVRAAEITGSIIFLEIDKAFTASKLYDDVSEAPAEFTTKTGVLDALLGEVSNDNEALYATYEWSKHITLGNTDENYNTVCNGLALLYMSVGQDRDKFINSFLEATQ